jgi:hypothetical protein
LWWQWKEKGDGRGRDWLVAAAAAAGYLTAKYAEEMLKKR